ncbi:hypothetical protein D9758_008819 [Tetrapyrgos nigripes]|uniref:C2H2-type domain-containing protein n=1 Tax=Tetrapyrgos nigripes TaxID=182062 RepID=A0A8H5CP01_9AGAR|nr:hypothetical protein D9758_008819 [Tetrapyrgos nigripes]
MPSCTQCDRFFTSQFALQAHCTDKSDHVYCVDCERLFVSFTALQQHLSSSPLHRDETDSEGATDSDSDSCSTRSEDDEPYCIACQRHFVTQESLDQHLRDSSLHNWCFICRKDFGRLEDLNRHNASRVHKTADGKCPLCKRMFKSPSDIANHIESGCHRNITRHHVAAAIHQMEIKPPISLRQIAAGESAVANSVVTTYVATQMAFNGTAYECYLCHREFQTLQALNQHLNSPVHDEEQFKCPHKTCGKEFTVVSALIRHIESESCGLAKFQTVERYADLLTAQFSRLLTL